MPKPTLFLLLVALLTSAAAQAQTPLDDVARLLEEQNMLRLRAQQIRPGVTIDSFRTDGCSGGLSDTWKSIAGVWPEFARNVGDTPPWEHCCVEHDRDYWRGETIDGFDKRLQADRALRQCVVQTGREQGAEIAQRFGLSEAEIVEVFNLTAELMYAAVRIGGGPCTGLAWRWGHGWPPCELDSAPPDEELLNAALAPPIRIKGVSVD